MTNREPTGSLFLLCFQKTNVFVGCGSADVADPCQFADIQLLTLVGGIVAKEGGGDVLFAKTGDGSLSCKYSENKANCRKNI